MSNPTISQQPEAQTVTETTNEVVPTPTHEEAQQLAEQKTAEANPLDMHAQMFYMYSPRLLNTMKLMSKKALVRLLFSLIQHPINDKDLKLRERIEQDAFQIADQMLTSKYAMIFVTGMEEMDRLAKEKEQEAIDKVQAPVVESTGSGESV